MDLPTTIASFLLAFLLVEATTAVVIGYRYAWSDGRLSVEAAMIEMCDLDVI